MLHLNASVFVELTLIALLAATLIYCALLERKLSALRKGQDGLKQTIMELNTAIISAGASMRALKAAAGEAAETLDGRIANARSLSDELSLITSSGERIAERIAGAAPAKPANGIHPASLMNRLKPSHQNMGQMTGAMR
jgi:phage shock protein A